MPKEKQKIICPNCNSRNIIKKGVRKNKLQTIQKYKCKDCKKHFTIQDKDIKHKTYPLKIILNAISTYNLGNTLEKTKKIINERYNLTITPPTILAWLNQYKICTFLRLRNQSIKQYKPNNIIFKQTLKHIQPYIFKYHKSKLNILIRENPEFSILKNYLQKISTKDFPHHIFAYHQKELKNNRASQIDFKHLSVEIKDKNNFANQLAKLALNLAKSNKQRHQAVQNFMLINDSTTIAVEIPVYLTNWDAGYYKNQRGFIFPLSNYTTPITVHIDILQIRNGLIHILDYKPDSHKQQPIEQLTIYALALSRKLNLPLYHFKCAWFDENNYYEFYPLHAVYPGK